MKLIHAEFVLSKQQAVIEVFKGTLETTALRVLQDSIIKQMLDSGCLTIEKVVDEEYDRVFVRIEVLVEKSRNTGVTSYDHQRNCKLFTGKSEVDWRD